MNPDQQPKDNMNEVKLLDKLNTKNWEWACSELCKQLQAMENEINELREELAESYKKLSGKNFHSSDCGVSIAPSQYPRPCDCYTPHDIPNNNQGYKIEKCIENLRKIETELSNDNRENK